MSEKKEVHFYVRTKGPLSQEQTCSLCEIGVSRIIEDCYLRTILAVCFEQADQVRKLLGQLGLQIMDEVEIPEGTQIDINRISLEAAKNFSETRITGSISVPDRNGPPSGTYNSMCKLMDAIRIANGAPAPLGPGEEWDDDDFD